MKDKMKKMMDLLFDVKDKIPDWTFLTNEHIDERIFDEL